MSAEDRIKMLAEAISNGDAGIVQNERGYMVTRPWRSEWGVPTDREWARAYALVYEAAEQRLTRALERVQSAVSGLQRNLRWDPNHHGKGWAEPAKAKAGPHGCTGYCRDHGTTQWPAPDPTPEVQPEARVESLVRQLEVAADAMERESASIRATLRAVCPRPTEVQEATRCPTCGSDDWYFDLIENGELAIHDSLTDPCPDSFHDQPAPSGQEGTRCPNCRGEGFDGTVYPGKACPCCGWRVPTPAAGESDVQPAHGIRVDPKSGGIEITGSAELVIEITEDDLDGGYVAQVVNLPGAVSEGETPHEALENLGDAVAGIFAARVDRQIRAQMEQPTSPTGRQRLRVPEVQVYGNRVQPSGLHPSNPATMPPTEVQEGTRGQSQASLYDQLVEAYRLANQAGLYDAADFIRDNAVWDAVERPTPSEGETAQARGDVEWIASRARGDIWMVLPPRRLAVKAGMRAEDWRRQRDFLTTRDAQGKAGRHGTIEVADLIPAPTSSKGAEEGGESAQPAAGERTEGAG